MPIFTAIAGIVAGISSFIGGLGAIGSFVLRTVAGIGLNLLAKAIAGKPEGPKFEIKGKIQGGGDVPRSFALGWTATAGSLVYQNEWGKSGKTPNAYTTRVIALFDLPVGELVQVMINGAFATLGDTPDPDMGYPVLEYRKAGKDYQWIKFYDGTQTVADPFLVGKVSSSDRPYESTRVGTGVAYAVCTSLLNQELYTGFPEYKFSVNGTKWYDPSKDSTVGGLGAHRWSNPATWGGDGDHLPAVQIYNLLRGVSFGGAWFYGLQNLPAARIPSASIIAQIEKCRAARTGVDGPEPTYRTGGEIPVNATVADTITALLTGSQGRLAEIGGTYDLHVGAPDDPSFSISDDDILSTEEQSFTPFYGLADTINGITAKLPNPAELWNVKVMPPLFNADYEAQDGDRRLLADVSLDLVPYVAQGQYLMQSALAEARRARRHTFVLPPKFWARAVPNAVFEWTSARNGYATKRFRIDGAGDKANLDNLVDITEVDPSDFSWNFDTDFRPVPDGPLGPVLPPVQEFAGWAVEQYVFTDVNGNARRPGILVKADGDLDDVEFVRVQVRRAGTTAVLYDQVHPYGDPATNPDPLTIPVEFAGILPATAYEARGLLEPYSGRETEWSDWLSVTTPNVKLGPDDLYPIDLAQLGDDIQDLLDGMQGDIGDNTAAIAAEAAARVADIAAQADALADEADARVTAVTAQAAALAQEVTDRAADVAGERADRIAMGGRQALDLRSLRDTVASAALQISDLYLKTATDQVTMRKEIVVSEGNARAYSDTQLTLAVGPTSALAAQLATLSASIAGVDSDLDAAITSLSEAIADGDAGEASARQALELQVRGSYTGTDLTLVTEGLIYQANQAMISETQALSTAIELVSAGVGILFDWSVLWSYNTSADGWAGNGAPTVSNGWLRPANHATDPYVLSPDNLDIDGDAYKQVKLRIRKTGTPTWQGQFWWQGDGDTTWDSGRRVTISEPSYVDGIAVITVDFAWSGTIKRIREDLSSDQDASNYFEIDWNSIGRPSPGASQAQVGRVQEALSTALAAEASDRETLSTILVGQADPSGLTLPTIAGGLVYDEKTARVAGDSALSTLITGVQSTLDDQADDIDALTTAQTTMQTAIDTLGDQVTLNASNIDDVEASLAGKADTAVTDALSAEIETMGGGAVASQVGQALRDIRLQLDKLALANFDLFATGQQQRLDLSGALVNVQQALTGRIDTTAGGLTLLGQAVTAIQLALPDYATLAVTDVLDGRVTATESSLTSAGSAITAIQAELPNKASVSAVEAAQDAADAAQADADAANTLAATKADATALDSLAATVTSQGGTISSHGSAITSLSNSLDTTNANVTTAQGAADAAQAAADAAQTSADGKSDVLFQSATPASGYRNSKTLWIDTTASANTPKRWDGSNWVTATDKVATDAAAAATAAQATADAANALAATKASTTVTDALQSQITSGVGGSSALAQTLRAVRASIDRLALSQFDLFAGGAQQRIDLSNIVASVNQSLTSRVDVTDGNVAVVVGRVDKLDAAIPGLASLGITSALDGRITANEAGLTSQGTSITAIQAALDGYTGADAVATAISSLDSRVTATESANTSQSTSITNLTNSLATTNSNVTAAQSAADAAQADADALETSKADASTVSTLSSTVTAQGDTLTSQGGAITSLQNALTGYTGSNAVANAISSLNTTVTGQGDDIDALSAAVTSVQSAVDGVSASGKFRIATQATTAGAQSTIGLIAEAAAGAETHTAGLLIDALSSGKSRVIALGDQFVFANPADLSNLKNAIVFDGAKAYLDEINVRELNASEVTVTGRFDASLILQDGTLITDLMAIDAVSEYANFDHTFVKHLGGGQSYSDGGWVKVKTTVVDNTAGKPMIEFVYLECTGTLSGSGNAYPAIRIVRNGVQIAFCQSNNAGLQTYSHSKFVAGTPATYTYEVYRNCDALTGGSSSAICDAKSESGVFHWKR